MPRGYRFAIIAAFGCLILGQGKQGWAADKQHRHKQPAAQPAPGPQPPDAAPADTAKKQCYPGSEIGVSCDGVSAQASVDQARDADKQAALVWPQFGVGLATLGAAVAAAAFAWSAAFHTRRSADAANNQANIAERLGEEQNRPYMMMDSIQNMYFNDGSFYGTRYKSGVAFSIIIKNLGSTPAIQASIYGCQGLICPIGSDTPTFKTQIELLREPGNIGPNVTANTSVNFPVGDIAYKSLIDRKTEVFLHAKCFYGSMRSVKPVYSTEICLRIKYEGSQKNSDGSETPYFNVTTTGKQNQTT